MNYNLTEKETGLLRAYQSQHDEHEKAKQRIMASVEGVIRLIAVQNGLNPNGENLELNSDQTVLTAHPLDVVS